MKIRILFLVALLIGQVASAEETSTNEYEKKAREALEEIVKEQAGRIKNIANSTTSGHEHNISGYVLSTHIRTFSDIPANIDNDIKEIKEQIHLLIKRVAIDIELSEGSSGSLSVDKRGNINYEPKVNLPQAVNDKRQRLLEANLKNSVSVRSAAMAIQLLASINDDLKIQADKAETRQQKERIYMTQATYVYEIADITLGLLQNLSLEGKAEIDKLHQDAKQRVNARVTDIDQQIGQAEQLKEKGLLTEEQLTKEKETYELMRKANNQSLNAWSSLINTVGKQQDFLDNLKMKSALIEYKRDKAKVQLETLRDIRQVAELRDTIGSLDELVSSVDSLDLLVLDETTVRELLGYDIDK
jgi:hypothetical protein